VSASGVGTPDHFCIKNSMVCFVMDGVKRSSCPLRREETVHLWPDYSCVPELFHLQFY
jgi:hypothetical protein